MNFLAHLYLTPPTPGGRIGSFLGDHVKGPLERAPYDAEIISAIRLHRAVDTFTDSHTLVTASKARLSAARRRYAGIIVDICYDHFLATAWQDHHAMPLEAFVSEVYRDLSASTVALPSGLAAMIPRLIEHDWLTSYRELRGIARALDGMGHRIWHAGALVGAVTEIEDHYDALRADFAAFFPELVAAVSMHARANDADGDAA